MEQNKLRKKYQERFEEAFNRLNDEQRTAVETLEGPVMVLAGPGTGKTQILAMRVANILNKIDGIFPHNILCLTFTDAATVAMRKRLVEIIGPEAHKVHIFTFHAFANQVIQENLSYFGNYRQLELLSDLERVDVYDKIINELPIDHPLKKAKSDNSFEAGRLDNLFNLMKQESLDTKDVHQAIEDFIQHKEDSGEYIAKRKGTANGKTYLKGDHRDDWVEKDKKKYEPLAAGAELFPTYNKTLKEFDRYDFKDMILWVTKAFQENEELLADYQERYHYFLVDEFQDTNGAQLDLISTLIEFMDFDPNVFVVGDDDQAIFKFQGANVGNINTFIDKYDATLIALKDNYRSSQLILDASTELIQNNIERVVNQQEGIEKLLVAQASNKDSEIKPIIKVYGNLVHEQADMVDQLYTMYKNGENLNEVAVIYRKHAQVEKLVEVLEKENVPINIKRKIDILKLPLIQNILNILEYLHEEYSNPDSEENRLFELMHYQFFSISARDIAKIALYKRQSPEHESYRHIMSDAELMKEIGIRSIDNIIYLEQCLDTWTNDISNVTIQTLFENIINQGYILKTALNDAQKTWQLQVISTFFDFIKSESQKNPEIRLGDLLKIIDKMKSYEIAMPVNKVLHSDKGINFITAHSAKGLEFEKVFIIGATSSIWDKSGSSFGNFSFPNTINADVKTNDEDERRLFFVAMTRAKEQLVISYSEQSESGKDLVASKFVTEIQEGDHVETSNITISEERVNSFQEYTLKKLQKTAQLIDHDLIDKVLSNMKLSVTALNKYLKCPNSFYFDNILRVPGSRNRHMGFGRAAHRALQFYFEEIKKKRDVDLSKLLDFFRQGMRESASHFTDQEYKDLGQYGVKILKGYFDHYLKDLTVAKDYEIEIKLDKSEFKGIPLKGVLDLVEVHDAYVEVVDYKTGDYTKPSTKAKLKRPDAKQEQGGDYWRQIVFYKMLLDSDTKYNMRMHTGYMDFVEPDKKTLKYERSKIVVSDEDIDVVGKQIQQVWTDIHDHKFEGLCDDEYCNWCDFVRNDYVFKENSDIDRSEEDQELSSYA